jgi:hypothetical protein
MMNFIKEIGQAIAIAFLVGGPFFYYFLFMMKP